MPADLFVATDFAQLLSLVVRHAFLRERLL